MKFLFSSLIITAALLLTSPFARATVAIYSGLEQHRTYVLMAETGNAGFEGVIDRPGRIFFLYDIETGRSVEIRLEPGKFKVRTERNLKAFPVGRRLSSSSNAINTTLMDAKRDSSTVDCVTVQGNKVGNIGLNVDPVTGMPSYFPSTLVSRQDYATTDVNAAAGVERVRKSSSLSLVIGQTKASNAASESFDAAVMRVKNILIQRGLKETNFLGNWADR